MTNPQIIETCEKCGTILEDDTIEEDTVEEVSDFHAIRGINMILETYD